MRFPALQFPRKALKKLAHGLCVFDIGHVIQNDRIFRKKTGCHHWQGSVLVARRLHRAVQWSSPGDNKFIHQISIFVLKLLNSGASFRNFLGDGIHVLLEILGKFLRQLGCFFLVSNLIAP